MYALLHIYDNRSMMDMDDAQFYCHNIHFHNSQHYGAVVWSSLY